MPKNILVTGQSGKIGQKLIVRLINKDLVIRVLKRKSDLVSSNSAKVNFLSGDLLDPLSLSKAVQGVEIIVHLAAVTHTNKKEIYWQVNTKGTENLIKAANKAGVRRFIFVSTMAINPDGGFYSQSKLAAEQIVKNSGIDWLILRPAEVYGAGGMIDLLVRLVKKSYLIPIINTDKCSFVPLYINDLVDVLEKVVLNSDLKDKTYTLAGPESFSFQELVEQICQFFGLKRLKIYCPLILLKLIFKMLSFIPRCSFLAYDQISRLLSSKSIDISLAQKDLGFKPISFTKGLSLMNRNNKISY